MRWLFARERYEKVAERLLFFDESGVNLSMTRHFARAPRGVRAEGHVPKNWGKSVTISAGIGLRGLIAPLVLTGSMTGDVFEAYVEQFIVPELRPDDIVVWDNLGAHRRPAARKLIEQAGASVVFLPPYSPDLNPIELAWSKVKASLRTSAARSYEALLDAIVVALRSISESDIAGWFRHAGFGPKAQRHGKML